MPDDLPPQVRNQLAQLQQLQQQTQVTMSQRVQMELQVKEIERTIEELRKIESSTPVYRSVGTLLIRAKDPAGVKKELEESLETTGIRLASLKRQEERLKERLTSLQKEVQAALGASQAG